MTVYTTARLTSRGVHRTRWQFEDGWATREQAEASAKFYRREYRRPCVVVALPDDVKPGSDEAARLLIEAAS
jgi:hypothetical protein